MGGSAGPVGAARGIRPTGYIEIPALALYEPIYEIPIVNRAYDSDQLGMVVGHLDQTGWIHDGNTRVVLAGHTPGVFWRLKDLHPGDRIIVWDSAGVVQYKVDYAVVTPVDNWRWLTSQGQAELMLITCEGDANRRVIIATPQGTW